MRSIGRALLVGLAVVTMVASLIAMTAQAPALTDVESLKLQIVSLNQSVQLLAAQNAICQGQLAPQAYQTAMKTLDADAQAIVHAYETAHPGFTLDLKTGQGRAVAPPLPVAKKGG